LFKSTQHDTINQPPIYEAKMSLQHAAKHLEKHGRNGDTVLVHMSKGEVKSLNDLAMANGGYLTINPHTGLPEAGFLQRMLPMVIGAGLAATGVGAPMAALMVGGGYTAATGSLSKGLMAGLGAYGGAGMGSALAESGMQSAAAASPEVVAAEQAAGAETLANAKSYQMAQQPGFVGPQVSPDMYVSQQAAAQAPAAAAREAALGSAKEGFASGTFTDNLGTMGKGVSNLGQPGGFSNFYSNLASDPNTYGAKTTIAAAAAPVVAEALKPEEQVETPVDSDPGQQFDYQANVTSPSPTPNPYGQENKYFNQQYVKRTAPRFAEGGISDAHYNLGGYSDGGRLLRGPGDGVSDSIPAVIGKKQPARLADGEFVVPARIVSELGNGSTEAGARKLYAMMDRIQKARGKTVGKGKVAKNSRSEKHLPA
jgi:hypothetical protein